MRRKPAQKRARCVGEQFTPNAECPICQETLTEGLTARPFACERRVCIPCFVGMAKEGRSLTCPCCRENASPQASEAAQGVREIIRDRPRSPVRVEYGLVEDEQTDFRDGPRVPPPPGMRSREVLFHEFDRMMRAPPVIQGPPPPRIVGLTLEQSHLRSRLRGAVEATMALLPLAEATSERAAAKCHAFITIANRWVARLNQGAPVGTTIDAITVLSNTMGEAAHVAAELTGNTRGIVAPNIPEAADVSIQRLALLMQQQFTPVDRYRRPLEDVEPVRTEVVEEIAVPLVQRVP